MISFYIRKKLDFIQGSNHFLENQSKSLFNNSEKSGRVSIRQN